MFYIQNITQMAEKLNEEKIEELRKVFNSMDANGDGEISGAELSYALRQAGITMNSEELNDLVADLDVDGDGKVDFSEFVNLASKGFKDVDSEEELKEVFMVFDKENKGVISPGQIKYVMRCLQEQFTDEEIDELIMEGDRDGDGMLSFEEFLGLMNAKEQQNK